MTLHSLVIVLLQLVLLLALAPALSGWIKVVKCHAQGRTAPGIMQPYRDIRRLFIKDVVVAENASWLFRFTPYLVFGVTVMIGGIVPLISVDLPLAATFRTRAQSMLDANPALRDKLMQQMGGDESLGAGEVVEAELEDADDGPKK